jgi:acyl-coenzyme A thioesterase PaaI-like protein
MLTRWYFNRFPAYRRTGGKITYISHDLREIRVEIPLNWKTRNYVGTIFGGSLYAAVDPMYMIMLDKNEAMPRFLAFRGSFWRLGK